eukprot:1846176-Lingulodinium_polyedra.AAC.1
MGPAFQYAAPALLYQPGAAGGDYPWHSLPMANVIDIIRGLMPQGLQSGWTQLNRLQLGQRPSTGAWQ